LLSPMVLIERPAPTERIEQALLADGGQQVPVVTVEAKVTKRGKADPGASYRAKLATFSYKELAGELRYKQNTLAKHTREGKPTGWIEGHIRDITAAIDAYEGERSEQSAPIVAPTPI